MSWIYLLIAAVFEIGWPIGYKLSTMPGLRWTGFGIALVCITLSGIFLWIAQREIPIGTAYAVWTGLGAAGTFLAGMWFFGEPASLMRYFGVILILSGVIVLKLAS
ncbi:MAG TPA: multidrug efflux SMR transporter [Chromatiales bacterium]|nr:multidrug efflux SMR transporter [Chromatiales bacterium]